MLCANIELCLQTTVHEESKNVKEDLKNILESVREEAQYIKKEIKALTHDILEAVVHHEAKYIRDPLGGRNHSTDKDNSLAAKRQFTASEGE